MMRTTSILGRLLLSLAATLVAQFAAVAAPSNQGDSLAADSHVAMATQAARSTKKMGSAAAARLLAQGTFGPTLNTVSSAANQSYSAWFNSQAAQPASLTLPQLNLSQNEDWTTAWWNNVTLGPDQLRQRMAFALSEIFVISDNAASLRANNEALAVYYDVLTTDSLGNFRTLLNDVTLSLPMGAFLNLWRSQKANTATGVHADQNYAREVMQLFTVGLVQLNQDGTVKTDSSGNPLPSYTQDQVAGLANALTGWASAPNGHTGDDAWIYDTNWREPMVAYADYHDTNAQTIIGGASIPAGSSAPEALQIALDTLFNHPNTPPFISKQLIQRLVTSNPSPAYVQRVAAVFADNGSGTRGDLLAVAKAILTDPEAVATGGGSYGKLREPLLRLTGLWRAFNASDATGNTVNEYSILLSGSTGTGLWGEYPLDAPGVFNFFRPDYEYPGALTAAGMVAPELQITNENTLVLSANQIQIQAYQFVDGNNVPHAGPDGISYTNTLTPSSVLLHTAQWESYATDPANLVDQMNLVLMANQMPSAMRTSLVNYASAIPVSAAGSRVAETAELIINSPQYAVQR